jgi:hypothetical protein
MRRTVPALLALILAFGWSPADIRAQLPSLVPDRVEEDWQLIIASPDTEGAGPQITTSMSPVADDSTPFVAFDLNYREYPSFQPGGMQVQVWSGKQLLSTATDETAQCSTPNETITWTQAMSVSAGNVSYQVTNGQSTTWGRFGQGQQLAVSFPSSSGDLGGYSPEISTANSGVSWESNLVTSMKLVQVRYYAAGALIRIDNTVRTIGLGD